MKLSSRLKFLLHAIPNKQIVYLCLATNALVLILVILTQEVLPPIIPLFYGQPQGASQLAPKIFLVIPPAVALLVTGVNVCLSRTTKDDFLWSVLLGGSILTTVLSIITVVKIVLLVGNI